MKYTDFTNNARIDNVEVSKAGTGLNLYYELDGEPRNVTGEFYIDKDNILHETAIDADDNEIEIFVKIEF